MSTRATDLLRARHPEYIEGAMASAQSAVAELPVDLGPEDEPANIFVAGAAAGSGADRMGDEHE